MKLLRFWNQPWALSMIAAVFLALSFPPYDLSLLQIPAFLCLFRICTLCDTKKSVIYYVYPSFVLWNLFTTYWLMMATVAGGVAAILANAGLMLIPLLLIRHVQHSKLNPILSAFVSASIWTSFEFLHFNWDLSWPWLTLGNGWSNLIGIIQYISVTGVLGISFWVVFSAALFYAYIVNPNKRHLLITAVVVFLLFPLFSIVSMVTMHYTDKDAIEVTVVQPNADSYLRYGGLSSFEEVVDKLLKLSYKAKTDQTDLIVWPENALDTSVSLGNPYLNVIRDSLRSWNASLITGSGFIEYYEEGYGRPDVVRESGSGQLYNVYNAALFLQPDGPTEVYLKGRLVPIVERFPYVDFLQKIDLLHWIDWGSIQGYGLGQNPTLFDINGHKTPALICYDSVFPGWVNEFAQRSAGFLTIITNDGWWGDSNGHLQHFAYARLRAIEQRMWIVRSANNGISGIISPDGRIQKKTKYWTVDAFSFTIYNSDYKTPYNKFGDWVGFLSLISALSGLIAVRFKR